MQSVLDFEINDTHAFDIDCRFFEEQDVVDIDFDFDFADDKERYINPSSRKITSKPIKYRNALSLAKEIGDIKPDDRFFCFLDGTFIFGDFLEAFIVHNKYNVTEMTLSTLSISENNIDSFKNLFLADYLQQLNIVCSDFWFSHERQRLVPYMYKELDYDNRFQFAPARVHTKVCLIKTECGKNIIIHGSANLRTSGNVEQIVIECDPVLFAYNYEWHHDILERYKTIKKTVSGSYLWGAKERG